MIVYLAAAIAAFLYLAALPVRAGAAWKNGQPLRVGVTVGPFRFSAHGSMKYTVGTGLIASLTHDKSGKSHELSLMTRMADAAAFTSDLAALSRAMKYLFRHVNPHLLKVRVRLSLPDAAYTAFLSGALHTFLSAVRAVRPSLPLTASVSADFRSMQSQFDLCGILSCRFGHIMAAAAIWCRDYLSRRFNQWRTSSRSKAS